jgi:hypothetical protein
MTLSWRRANHAMSHLKTASGIVHNDFRRLVRQQTLATMSAQAAVLSAVPPPTATVLTCGVEMSLRGDSATTLHTSIPAVPGVTTNNRNALSNPPDQHLPTGCMTQSI